MPFGGNVALLQQLLGQSQGQPQGQAPVQPGVTPGTTPTTMPGPSGGMGTSPILQQALARMSNPQSNTVPQQPQQIPQGADHPALRHILQVLGSGLAGAGYGMMNGNQQQASQELEAKKAETMANIAATQQWREQTTGINQQKANTQEQRANTAEEMAKTMSRKVDAYKELGAKRNQIMQDKSDWEKDIASGNLDNAVAKTAQSYKMFQQGLEQKKDLFEQDMDYKNLALESGNYYKEAAQNIMRTALAQGGTAKAAEVMQKAAGTGLEHYMQEIIGNVPSGQQIMGQAQTSGMPGVPTPSVTPGAPSPGGTPPMPATGTPPTPQAKAAAKSSQKPKTGGGKVITYDAQGNRVGG
jgi:hypothetical protein